MKSSIKNKLMHSQNVNAQALESLIIHYISLSVFLILEYITDILLFWIPFYYYLKALLVIWLSIPFFGGSKILYLDHIKPFLIHHEQEFDKSILKFKGIFKNQINLTASQVTEKLKGNILSNIYGISINQTKPNSPLEKNSSFTRKKFSKSNLKEKTERNLGSNSRQKSPEKNLTERKKRESVKLLGKTQKDSNIIEEDIQEQVDDLNLEDYYMSDFD